MAKGIVKKKSLSDDHCSHPSFIISCLFYWFSFSYINILFRIVLNNNQPLSQNTSKGSYSYLKFYIYQ